MDLREIDRLVAEHVMEWPLTDKCVRRWRPTTSIAAAWRVVEKMRQQWYKADPHETKYWRLVDCGPHGWRAEIIWGHHDGDIALKSVLADTLPLAICLAALRAVGVEVPGA